MNPITNNESINRLLRRGEGAAGLTGFPVVSQIVDGDRQLLQEGHWVPIADAQRAIEECARCLLDVSGNGPDGTVAVDRDLLQGLLLAIVRVEPLQRTLVESTPPLPQRIEGERKLIRACHAVATSIASKLEKQPRTLFESYAELLNRSPDPALTLRMLSQAGKESPSLMDASGPIAPIAQALPPTLPAGATVELRVRVHRVDDRTGLAVVEKIVTLDARSEQLLVHHGKECELRFDSQSIERADLTAAQYLDVPVRIRCAAECATLPALTRKSNLTLVQVLEEREVMDGMHRAARQYQERLGQREQCAAPGDT